MVNKPRIRGPRRPQFKIHGWIIEQKGTNKAMTINGPERNDVIALFIDKSYADKVLLRYSAGYAVKHYGLIALKD